MKKAILVTIIGVAIILGVSFAVTAGMFWVVCWCVGWTFSWKIALAVWIVLLVLQNTFGGSGKE